MVGDHEAAGAIPAIQTMPPLQGWNTRLRISSAEVQFLSVVLTGRSSEAERVGDNHDVAGAIPAVQTIDPFLRATVPRTEHDSAKIVG